MKTVTELKTELEGRNLSFGHLNRYMVEAGYHSNLDDVDLLEVKRDSKLIFLGKEEPGKVEMTMLITRQSAFAENLYMVITDIKEMKD